MMTAGSVQILLVEDESIVRRLLLVMLQRLGHDVVSAATGEEALRLIDEEGAAPQLLLTDMILPGGTTGLDVADQVLQRVPGVRILIASGYSSGAPAVQAVVARGIELLQKPFTVEALEGAIRRVIDAT